MKKMIITADDYGMSRGVNDAIDEGIAKGLITSTNVMTNMEFYTEASKLRDTDVSVGLHWTISAGKPVCKPEEIPSLVDENGNFFKYSEFRGKYRKGEIKDEDIVKELKAQYKRFKEVCGEPDYWNTHQNTHVDFKIFKLFVLVAKELNIRKMRSHQRVYVPASAGNGTMPLVWRIIEPIKRQILKSWMNIARKNGMTSPYGVVIALRKEDLEKPEYVFSNIQQSDDIVSEYVIHPSTVLDSNFFGSLSDSRIVEYKQFTSDKQANIFNKNDFVLINFENI